LWAWFLPAEVDFHFEMSLIFDEFRPRAQCFVGLLAAATVFERRLYRQIGQPFRQLSYDAIVEKASGVSTQFRIREEKTVRYLDAYLRPPDQHPHTAIDDRNASSVTGPLCDFIADLLAQDFFLEGRPLDLACKGKLGSAQDREVANRLRQLMDKAYFRPFMTKQPLKLKRNESLSKVLNDLFGDTVSGMTHPEFSSLALFDIRALKVEFHGVERRYTDFPAKGGLYAVVREPRGWAAENLDKTNIIVRDVFWLTPRKSYKGQSHWGFYASVIDGSAFVIDQPAEEDDFVTTAHGVLRRKKRSALRIRLVFAKPLDSTAMSHGVLAGTAGDGRAPTFAAWKTLVISTDWDDSPKLQGVLFQLEAEDHQLAFDLLADVGVVGVLYSKRLRAEKESQERREKFRSLIDSDQLEGTPADQILGDFLSKDLQTAIAGAIGGSGRRTKTTIVDNVMSALGDYVKSRWHLIEPAQIIMYKALDKTTARDEALLRIMLNRNIARATKQEQD
jgi:hypothetical protein